MATSVDTTFDDTVEQGQQRVGRSWPSLLATGTVGGIDVSLGILGLLLVEHETQNILLAALAFSIGFIALSLAGSELFTENFWYPSPRWPPTEPPQAASYACGRERW